LLDRFDIAIWVDRPQIDELIGGQPGETTVEVAARVSSARRRAADRGFAVNAELPGSSLDEVAPMSKAAAGILERQVRSGSLSARGLHRVRRLARTVADLDADGDLVEEPHVHEALALRCRRGMLLGKEDR
jgi:magnesium chelatase family protein